MQVTIHTPVLSDVEKLALDFQGLIEGFTLAQGFMTAETLRVFAVHHDVKTLGNLGWIRPGHHGRWTSGFYPAGALEAELSKAREAV